MSHPTRRRLPIAALALIVAGWGHGAAAQFKADPLAATTLPAKPGPHWVWVNDIVFNHMADGKTFLVDGDSGRMLGMLSTGFGYNGVVLPGNGAVILSPEIYFSRHTRGKRTDVVTIYDGRKLNPVAEIGIPPKRVSAMPMLAQARLTDDDRFLLIYNYTPAQSVCDFPRHVAQRRTGAAEVYRSAVSGEQHQHPGSAPGRSLSAGTC